MRGYFHWRGLGSLRSQKGKTSNVWGFFFRHYELVIKILTTALTSERKENLVFVVVLVLESKVLMKEAIAFPIRPHSAIWHNKDWIFTIYTNHPGKNLLHKHKTLKFDVVGERPATKYIEISWTDEKEWKNYIALKSQPIFSEASQSE